MGLPSNYLEEMKELLGDQMRHILQVLSRKPDRDFA